MLAIGSTVTVEIERPAVGGRMLARHDGEIVLVSGGIPGELALIRVEARHKGVAHAAVIDLLRASPDRIKATDPSCGGRDYAHIARARQRVLKRQQVSDALARIARCPDATVEATLGDDRPGRRLRARLHWDGVSIGFLRSGSHEVCGAGLDEQLSPSAADTLDVVTQMLGRVRVPPTSLDLVENIDCSERAVRINAPAGCFDALAAQLAAGPALVGACLTDASRGADMRVGRPWVIEPWASFTASEDALPGRMAEGLRRQPHAFFQADRYLLPQLMAQVLGRVMTASVVDLYSGVGLFGLAAAERGAVRVWCVEGDVVSGDDLLANAAPYGHRVRVSTKSVETWLRGRTCGADTTIVVDPPRTGLSRRALDGIVAAKPAAVVYVSCDPATFARDVARLCAHGFVLGDVQPLDLFPDTGHVEVVAALTCAAGAPASPS